MSGPYGLIHAEFCPCVLAMTSLYNPIHNEPCLCRLARAGFGLRSSDRTARACSGLGSCGFDGIGGRGGDSLPAGWGRIVAAARDADAGRRLRRGRCGSLACLVQPVRRRRLGRLVAV
jgi:hypothetical protein